MSLVVGELQAKLGIDFTEFASGLKTADTALKNLANQINSMKVGLPSSAVKSFSDVTASSTALKAALSNAIPVSAQLTNRLQEQQTQYGLLGSKLAEVSAKYGEDSTKAAQVSAAMQKLGNQINVTKAALEGEASAADKAAKAEKGVGDEAESAKTKVGGFGEMVKNALSTAGGILLAKGIEAASSAISSGIASAIDFEHALSGVSAVAGGLTNTQLEGLRQKALQIGADTSLSASQAVSAFEALVANGVDPTSKSFNSVADSTVALAEATGGDLTTAANIATDTLANFKLSTDDLQNAVNGIVGVTVAGKFGIDDYRLALANAGGVAGSMGVSLTDFNTVLAGTASLFASGSDAGTAYKTFLVSLTGSSSSAKDAMKELGLITADGTNQFFDASGNMKSMADVTTILANATKGLTKEQEIGYLKTIFGVDAYRMAAGAIDLAGQSADGTGTKFNQLAQDIAKINAADQAKTRLDNFAGATEALKGSIETVSIVIAGPFLQALTPLVQEVASAVGAFGTFANSILSAQNPLQTLLNAIDSVIPGFADLANQAIDWGANIVTQFSNGIMSQLAPLVAALQQIGATIRAWLMPGSPPAIVPDLDQYGKDAATVYYQGWSQGDFSALQEMGGTIQSVLKGMVDAGKSTIGEQGVIPMVLGSQNAISAAIQSLRDTGTVGEDSIKAIIDSAGEAGPQIDGLVRSFFDLEKASKAVSDAQQELNAVTEEYSQKLAPLNDQMKQIKAQQQQIKDKEKLKDLQEKMADASVSESDKQLAALEIQEIQTRQQIDAVKSEGDAATSAAKAKLDAAKEVETQAKAAYDAQKAQVQAYNQQNQLISQQTKLLQQLANANKGGGSGGGGGIGKIDVPDMSTLAPTQSPLTPLIEDATKVTSSFMAMKDSIAESADQVQIKVAPVITFVQQMIAGIQQAFTTMMPYFSQIGSFIQSTIIPPITVVGSIISTTIMPVLTQFAAQIMQAFSGQGSAAINQFGALFMQLGSLFESLKPALMGLVALIGGSLYGAFYAILGVISGALPGGLMALQGAFQAIQGVIQVVQGVLAGLGQAFVAFESGDMEGLKTAMLSVWENIKSGVANIVSGLVTVVIGIAGGLLGGIAGIMDNIFGVTTGTFGNLAKQVMDTAVKLRDNVINTIGALWNGFTNIVSNIYNSVVGWFQKMYDELVGHSIVPDMVDAILRTITNLGTSFTGLISDLYTGVVDWFTKLGKDALTSITTLKDNISGLASQFLSSAETLGKGVIDGMINGITNGISSLVDAARNAAQKMLDAARNALDSHSPSREFAKLGIDSVNGIIVGIETQLPDLLKTVRNMSKDMLEKSTQDLQAIKDAYAQTIHDITVTVTQSRVSFNNTMIASIKDIADLAPQGKVKDIVRQENDLQTQLIAAKKKAAEDASKNEIEIASKTAEILKLKEANAIESNDVAQKERAAQIMKLEQDIQALRTTNNAKSVTDIQDQLKALEAQKAKAKALEDAQTKNQLDAQAQLKAAQEEYYKLRLSDPEGAAKIFEEKRKQIMELAKLDNNMLQAKYDGDQATYKMLQAQRAYVVENAKLQITLAQDQAKADDDAQKKKLQDIKNLAAELEKSFSDAGFKSIGTSITAGIVQGIKDASTTLQSAITQSMKTATDALKSALGIHSPSTVFADQIGKPVMEGWAEGILSNQNLVSSATIDAGKNSINAAMSGRSVTPVASTSSVIYNISLDLSGSTLSKTDVEKILDTRLDTITRAAIRIRK